MSVNGKRLFFNEIFSLQESAAEAVDIEGEEESKNPMQDPDELDLGNIDDSGDVGHGPLSPGFEGDTTIYQSASESLLSEPDRNVEPAEDQPEGNDDIQGENDVPAQASNNELDDELDLNDEMNNEQEDGQVAEVTQDNDPEIVEGGEEFDNDVEKGEMEEALDVSLLGKEGQEEGLDNDLEKEEEESEERRQKQLEAEKYGTEPVSSDDDIGNHDDHVELDYDEGDLDDGEKLVVEGKHDDKVITMEPIKRNVYTNGTGYTMFCITPESVRILL